jgi:hypothetical protein
MDTKLVFLLTLNCVQSYVDGPPYLLAILWKLVIHELKDLFQRLVHVTITHRNFIYVAHLKKKKSLADFSPSGHLPQRGSLEGSQEDAN